MLDIFFLYIVVSPGLAHLSVAFVPFSALLFGLAQMFGGILVPGAVRGFLFKIFQEFQEYFWVASRGYEVSIDVWHSSPIYWIVPPSKKGGYMITQGCLPLGQVALSKQS